MPKKSTKKPFITGYAPWNARRTIQEAENIARWKPWLAHEWLTGVKDTISIESSIIDYFDSAVHRINLRWFYYSMFPWFNEVEFWEKDGELCNRTYIDPIFSSSLFGIENNSVWKAIVQLQSVKK